MAIDIKNIQGWKWKDLETAQARVNDCNEFLGIPNNPDTDVTQTSFVPIPNFNSVGEITFYYVGYSYPSQLALVPAMGDPTNFDINIEIQEPE